MTLLVQTLDPAAKAIAARAHFCNLGDEAQAVACFDKLQGCDDSDADPEQVAGYPPFEAHAGRDAGSVAEDMLALANNVQSAFSEAGVGPRQRYRVHFFAVCRVATEIETRATDPAQIIEQAEARLNFDVEIAHGKPEYAEEIPSALVDAVDDEGELIEDHPSAESALVLKGKYLHDRGGHGDLQARFWKLMEFIEMVGGMSPPVQARPDDSSGEALAQRELMKVIKRARELKRIAYE